jgi:ParB family chromosome partitioning protein
MRARVEYYTPPDILEAARALYGVIDLDPASCRAANEVVQATNFYSIRDNGLTQAWYGRIWINPPFPWKPWVPKLLAEWQTGNVEQFLALSTTRVTTAKYFNPLIAAAAAILKMNGRIKFWGPSAGDSPDDGHELFYFGPDPAAFEQQFAPFGRGFFTGRQPYRAAPWGTPSEVSPSVRQPPQIACRMLSPSKP